MKEWKEKEEKEDENKKEKGRLVLGGRAEVGRGFISRSGTLSHQRLV